MPKRSEQPRTDFASPGAAAWINPSLDRSDEDALARLARTTTAAADIGLLTIATGEPHLAKQCLVSVVDDGGEPLLLIPTQTALWETTTRASWASLLLKPTSAGGVGLQLSGRLHRLDHTTRAAPGGHAYVVLRVERVQARCPQPSNPAASRPISILRYATAEPDLFVANAPRLVRHVNVCHQEALRRWAARHLAVDLTSLAGVTLSGLDQQHAQFWVTTADGGRRHDISFARPVRNIEAAQVALRTLLAG